MRIKITVAIAITLCFLACTPTIQSKIETQLDPLEFKIEEAIGVWNGEKAQKGYPDRTVDATWLDVGIRYKYFILKKYVNIQMLEKVAGVPVYASGPHKDGIDFNSTDFGRYNPAFLRKVKNVLLTAMKREAFNKLAQSFYDGELKSMSRTYHRAYEHAKGLDKNEHEFGGSYSQEEFRAYADQETKAGYDWYESVTAPGFWSRRVAGGTDKAFIELLEIVLNKYDKGFLN